jgi:alpha-L-arabinofuranosidase
MHTRSVPVLHRLIPAAGLALAVLHPVAARGDGAATVLRIDADRVLAHSSPNLHGLMTEEINHSYDGGLYGELVSNRTFQDDPGASGAPVHWSLVRGEGGAGAIALDRDHPFDSVLPISLRLDILAIPGKGKVGVANDGFWGVPVRPHEQYRVSFLARASGDASAEGAITVALESADGSACYARATVARLGSAWARHSLVLSTGNSPVDGKGRLVIASSRPGTVWLNLVSCFPPTWHGRPNGNRPDLMALLAGLHPSFLRFPGGNYLEGDTPATRFDWKRTIHGLGKRPGHPQPWGYRSSDGLGLLEFLEWCEDLRMQPVLAVYAGYSFQTKGIKPGPALEPYVRDALDEIEYVTGDPAKGWGAVRAADGHPAPFALTYVEIGNEDPGGPESDYDGRFAQFFDAIKAIHPGLQLIATSPVKGRTPDVLDEHFYLPSEQMLREAHRYDAHPRTGPRIFVGEWATIVGTPWKGNSARLWTPDLAAALADAAWMTGLERNSDLVIMASYAPLLVNVNPGAAQWQTDLIGYDGLSSYGSPSYHAQAMFAAHRGDLILASSKDDPPGFFHSVTRDSRTGTIHLKCVNTTARPIGLTIELSGAAVAPAGTVVTLSASRADATNSVSDPNRVVPVVATLEGLSPRFSRVFPAYSVSVLDIPAR